jgi:coproporphyrinogen III oxidase-like Fe-S oxidoreductase
VIPDSLISGTIRDISRRYLSFENSPADVRLPAPSTPDPVLLYLHIPFCVVLCPFCAFHRVEFKRDRAQTYFRALRQEILRATDAGFRFGELYIGGGTPTVLPEELIETIKLVRELHPVQRISTEANPDDLDEERLLPLRNAGINRLSIGVQSFDDVLLQEMRRLGKFGSGALTAERLKRIQGTFETLNVDMIFNLPHQTDRSLQRDLDILTNEIAVDQVSFYPLMTAGSARQAMRPAMGVVDYSREKCLYRVIVEHMRNAGYIRSSVWCFSRSANMIDEYSSRQTDYLGLGSGAFSYLDGAIYAGTFAIDHYLHLIESGRMGVVSQRTLTRLDQMRCFLLMRMFGGSLNVDLAERQFGGRFMQALRAEITGLRLLGAITQGSGNLYLTERGYNLWVMMMREFFSSMNNIGDTMRHDQSREARMLSTGVQA